MKIITQIVFLILGLVFIKNTSADAQTHHEYLVTLNNKTAAYNRLDSIPGVVFLSDNSTYDQNHKHFIFQGNKQGFAPWNIYTLDANTGSVLYSARCPSNQDSNYTVYGIQYDNSSDTLYGLFRGSSNVFYFSWIDQQTGAITIKKALSTVDSYTLLSSTYDKNHHRYMFQGILSSQNRLIVIDAHTGNIIYTPTFSVSGGVSYPKYDNLNNTFYAVATYSSWTYPQFDSINIITGVQYKIADLPEMSMVQNGTVAIDEDSGKFIFASDRPSMDSGMLYTLNMQTGQILDSVPYNYLNSSSPTSQNIINYCFDNNTRTLYAANWGVVQSTGIKDENAGNINFNVYPNPSSSMATIELKKPYNKAIVILYNSMGQVIKNEIFHSSPLLQINTDMLPSGIYFISVVCDKNNWGTKKIIIE